MFIFVSCPFAEVVYETKPRERGDMLMAIGHPTPYSQTEGQVNRVKRVIPG